MAEVGYGSSDEKKMEWFKQVGISGFCVRHCPQCKQENLIVTSYANSKISDCNCNNCGYRCVGMEGFNGYGAAPEEWVGVDIVKPVNGKCCFFCIYWDRPVHLKNSRNVVLCKHKLSAASTAPYMTCDKFEKEVIKNGEDLPTGQGSEQLQ